MTLLEEVRARLRLKSTTFDDLEIEPLIFACISDLARVGIIATEETDDPLIRQAVVLYCKANFGYSDAAEAFQQAYEGLRDAIALSGIGGDG